MKFQLLYAFFSLVPTTILQTTLAYAQGTPTCPATIFQDSVPSLPVSSDQQGVELGVKFRTRGAVAVTAIRFYKFPENNGVHTGHLWSPSGQLLASVTFPNETESGWQTATLPSPIYPTPGSTLIASYYAPNGRYAVGRRTDDDLTNGAGGSDSPVYALADGVEGGNGVYQYGGGFPSNTYFSSNYYVDVVVKAISTPTPPNNLYASSVTSLSVTLNWSPSTEGAGELGTAVAKYLLYRDDVVIATISGTKFTDSTVASGSTYSYKVVGQDYCGIMSSPSQPVSVQVPSQ